MDRYTGRNEHGDLLLCDNEVYGNNQDVYNALTQLEDYEDTGLTPEEITALIAERATLKKALKLACERIAEYAFCGGTESMKSKHAEKNFQHFIRQAQEQEGKK